MSTATTFLIENLCRTCMGEEESQCFISPERETAKALFSIFNEPQQTMACSNMTIMDLLKQTTPQLTIELNDMLPKNVCKNCLDKLVNIHEFQQNCLLVEQRLLELIKENDTTASANEKEDDPLTSNRIHEAFTDLRNIIKIEMQEHLIYESTNKPNDDAVSHTEDGYDNGHNSVWMENSGEGGGEDENVWNNPSDEITLSKTCTSIRANKIFEEVGSSLGDNEDSSLNVLAGPILESKQFACDECGSRLKTRKSLRRHQKIHLRPKVDTKKRRKGKYKNECGSADDSDDEDYNTNEVDEEHIEQQYEADDRLSVLKGTEEEGADTSKVPSSTNSAQHSITKADTPNDQNCQEKPFVCDECGSRLKTRKSLKRHKRIHLRQPGVKEEPKTKHECEYCQKIFHQSSSLKDHLRTHTGEQPYLCSECGKSFKSLSNMKQHFLRHGTDRPYECPDCPKKFPCLSDLASHKAVHGKSKSHICDVCGAGFVKPYLLKKHKMYHTGEKKHKCDYCDMRFVLSDQCRRHMRTHTGEKPYKCKYCVRAFAQSNDLIKHLRGHLGDNVYKCDMCPQGFRLQGDLRAHFNTHKNDDDETRTRNLLALKEEELRIQLRFGLVQTAEEQ